MAGVITARDLKLVTSEIPEGRCDHVSIDRRIRPTTYRIILVIPPESIVLHPVLLVFVRKSGDKSPVVWVFWGCKVPRLLCEKEKEN